MAVESAADRLSMLADFGLACRITYATGGRKDITAILDNEYAAAELTGEVALETTVPILTARTADLSAAAHGDAVRVTDEDGTRTNYTIRGLHPDGTGVTQVILEKG
jgi:hypothetical protein